MVAENGFHTPALPGLLANDAQLGPYAGAVLQDPESEPVLPAIVLAEACGIVRRGGVALSAPNLLAVIDAAPRMEGAALNRTMIAPSVGLTAIGMMHDCQIVATLLVRRNGLAWPPTCRLRRRSWQGRSYACSSWTRRNTCRRSRVARPAAPEPPRTPDDGLPRPFREYTPSRSRIVPSVGWGCASGLSSRAGCVWVGTRGHL